MRVPQGQPVRVSVEIRDLTEALVEPSSVVLDYLGPLGLPIVVGPTAVRDGLGLWHVDLDDDLALLGHYALRWTIAGPGAGVKSDSIDVLDPFAMELLSRADAKEYVQIGADNTEHDAEIDRFLAAMAPAVEFFVGGPIEPRTMTRTVRGTRALVLPVAPVLEVVTMASYGLALSVVDYDLDEELGVIRYVNGAGCFRGDVDVTFVAGRRIVPEAMNHAAKVIFSHLWETQRGRGSNTFAQRGGTSTDVTFVPALGYSVPNRAIQMLKPISTRTGLS